MRVTVTLQTPARALDVLVDCDESGPAAELERRLRALAGAPDAPMVVPRGGPTTLDGGIPTGRGTVADLGLLDGSRIGFLGADVSPPRLGRGLQLHVVSGPDSGAVLPLPAGTHEIGRSGALSWADHSLSRRHCRVGVTSVAVTVTDLGSSNGTAIDGRACPPQVPVSWRQGESLEVGDSLCELRVGAAAAALTEPAAPGWLRLQRPPRVRGAAHPLAIDLPPAPRGRGWRGGRAGPSDLGDDVRRLLREAVLQEQKEARGLLPDPASTVATVLQHGRRLWERRPEDDDFLVLRVGTGPRPAGMELRGGTPADRPWLRDVPVAVSLRGTPVLGVAGPGAVGDAVLRWLLLQLCAAHAPGDLGLTVLSSRADEAWSWLRWLPHLRPAGPAGGAARVGVDPSGHQARLGDLLATVRRRRAGERGAAHVVVVHGHRALADAPGGSAALTELLRDGPSSASTPSASTSARPTSPSAARRPCWSTRPSRRTPPWPAAARSDCRACVWRAWPRRWSTAPPGASRRCSTRSRVRSCPSGCACATCCPPTPSARPPWPGRGTSATVAPPRVRCRSGSVATARWTSTRWHPAPTPSWPGSPARGAPRRC